MATHKSAAKRARQDITKNARNSNRKSIVKTAEKKLTKALDTKSKDSAALLKAYVAEAMKAVSKGSLKKETVSRHISRLTTRTANLSK